MRVARQRALMQASTDGSVPARCQALGLARSSYCLMLRSTYLDCLERLFPEAAKVPF